MSGWKERVLAGVAAGRPEVGPSSVHIDVTNGCNAACVTCWDHSPLLTEPRPAAWKRRRLPLDRLEAIVAQLDALGSVRHVVLSGMGEPLTHPDIYAMIAAVKARGWRLTLISNLVAADPERLAAAGVDDLLAGVQGATPDSYAAFHPGWTERHFFDLCAVLRRLSRTSTRVRHVQVINRDTAPEVEAMVRFGHLFRADRVNYKLASLRGGTEGCAMTEDQRAWLLAEGIPRARARAAALRVRTNLDLFERQVAAGGRATAPMGEIGCFMGYVFTRVTVDEEVLFCCNTEIRVGSLREAAFADLWWGDAWQALRARLAAGGWFPGCDQCGKLEQNVRWSELAAAREADEQALLGVSA
ncbi:MAG TPA: radical SAM protein [Myxococcota bacterium]|nr:radical SAM protein [Myxococcota bacterium]